VPEKKRRERASDRRRTHATEAKAERYGLTFLQRYRAKPTTLTVYDNLAAEFLEWARVPALTAFDDEALDTRLAEYLDVLYWEGHQSETGSRLLAAIAHFLPALPSAKNGGLPRARCALAGFRRRAHGSPLTPLPKPVVLGLIGLSALDRDFEYCGALALAWDAMIRLPSDLVSMRTTTLVGPGRGARPRWALLLYPAEAAERSKTLGADEGVILEGKEWRSGGSRFLERLLATRAQGDRLWTFSAPDFISRFHERLARLPGRWKAVPYQLRHGAASHAAAIRGVSLAELQNRLRHTSPQSTLRYARHVRYLSELAKVPDELAVWAEEVERLLPDILASHRRPSVPPFLKQTSSAKLSRR